MTSQTSASSAASNVQPANALSRAMLEQNWQFDTAAPGWSHSTSAGPVQLLLLEERADFQRLKLVGGALSASSNGRALLDNYRLPGPLKFVARRSGAPICRVDVPLEFDAALGERFTSTCDLAASEPLQAWANVLTACVCGMPTQPAAALDLPAMREELQRQGWTATVDEGQLHVHVNLPGAYRQVRVEQAPLGIRVATNLADLSGYGKSSLRAAAKLAHEANARLPLVRYASDELSPHLLRAEVCWGAPSIPGAWLATALEVVEAAIALTAREITALRDPELAQLVLAAGSGPHA